MRDPDPKRRNYLSGNERKLINLMRGRGVSPGIGFKNLLEEGAAGAYHADVDSIYLDPRRHRLMSGYLVPDAGLYDEVQRDSMSTLAHELAHALRKRRLDTSASASLPPGTPDILKENITGAIAQQMRYNDQVPVEVSRSNGSRSIKRNEVAADLGGYHLQREVNPNGPSLFDYYRLDDLKIQGVPAGKMLGQMIASIMPKRTANQPRGPRGMGSQRNQQ